MAMPHRLALSLLLAAVAGIGVFVIAETVVVPGATFIGPGGASYYQETVQVPSSADEASPMLISFHGASFSLWWPPPITGPSSGVNGVAVQITEPSGAVVQTGTGCGACGDFQESWYSPDASVGILWTASSGDLGDVTLLVAE